MDRKRILGTAAAIGGLAAFALLAGVPNAKADEVSDLRANNELLQQRLDQVAQIGNVGPSRVFSTDAQAMTAAATAGSFPRSFLIPGTDTSIRVGGNITWIADYYLEGGQANGSPWSTTIGANGSVQSVAFNNTTSAKSAGDFGESMRQSQLSVETRTPTPYGEARSYMSFDWAGATAYAPGGTSPAEISDNLVPRLKYAYGTLGGWLAGQANSNFSDPDANSETLDFGGNVGEPGRVRVAQLRYTMPLSWAWGGALSFSAENPEVEVFTPNGICGSDAGVSSACVSPGLATPTIAAQNVNPAKPVAPAMTAALYIPQPWGHIDLSALLRPDIGLADGAYYSKDFVGGGGHLGFDIKPGWFTPKDDFTFHFTGGTGLGGYLNSSTNAAIETNLSAVTTGATGVCGAGRRRHDGWRDDGKLRRVEDDPNVGRRNRLPALVERQPALDVQLRRQPPVQPECRLYRRADRRGEQGAPDGSREPDVEPGVVRDDRHRVHVGRALGCHRSGRHHRDFAADADPHRQVRRGVLI